MSGPRFDDTRMSIEEMVANIEHQCAQLEDASEKIQAANIELQRLQAENARLRAYNFKLEQLVNELMAQISDMSDDDGLFKNEDYNQ